MPQAPAPMLCTLIAEPFNNPDWIFETKFDGLRVLGIFDGKDLTLLSRNQASQNVAFPDIADALRKSLSKPAIVDGEVVCLDRNGRSSFRLLQQRFHLTSPSEAEKRSREYPAVLYLFDLIYTDRYDVSKLPLKKRKQLLRQAVRWSDQVRWTEYEAEDGHTLFQSACREGGEGIIGKRLDNAYVPGRSSYWVKIKCLGRQEFVIGGFTDPQRSRVGLGALLVGYYSDDGKRLIYAGKVGTGYSHQTLLNLRERLDGLTRRQSPFDEASPRTLETIHWVEPRLVAEIAFAEWTQHNILRQPRFEGLRTDKKPTECRKERPRAAAPAELSWSAADRRSPDPLPGETKMNSDSYAAKRDFAKTPEPQPRSGRPHRKPIFVVQEHHASRLHYDFRLEADGVLMSWAVPKEPSMDPSQKRLAVHVEDHPLAYADFEGTIPEGQYGAGTVEIWDKGSYENLSTQESASEAVAAGKLEFELSGKKLHGRFALIRMQGRMRGKDNWLLIKMKDEFADPEPSSNGRAKHAPVRRERAAKIASPKRRGTSALEKGEVPFTHLDKVMFPDEGITKGDVIEFYRKVSPHLLPFLKDRPATLERLPDGLGRGSPHFWQKNTPASYPDWIPRVNLPTTEGKPVDYVLVNDLDTLLYLVNQGTLTFHVWMSRVDNVDQPDFVLFDLDPGKASFSDAVAVANQLHAALQSQRQERYVKTSGKTGLHILVPWEENGGYDEARDWALGVATQVAKDLSDIATIERGKSQRGRRVYIDVMQNTKGHHAVPPYVLRAVPGATVSTPLNWNELTSNLDPSQFTLATLFRRLARQKRDPMAGLARRFGRTAK
jgi:bifunctional non-homologous end joining protein LigD